MLSIIVFEIVAIQIKENNIMKIISKHWQRNDNNDNTITNNTNKVIKIEITWNWCC